MVKSPRQRQNFFGTSSPWTKRPEFSSNVHDDGSSPSVMKALATETQRKSFFSLLCAFVAIFFHGKGKALLCALRVLRGSLRAFCDIDGGKTLLTANFSLRRTGDAGNSPDSQPPGLLSPIPVRDDMGGSVTPVDMSKQSVRVVFSQPPVRAPKIL